MNEENFNSQRSTVSEDRPNGYRFYENEPTMGYPPTSAPLSAANQQQAYYRQMTMAKDEKHLDQLSLGFKIYAGLNALISCIPFLHLFMGIMIVTGGFGNEKGGPPPEFGWFFIIGAAIFIALGWTLSICNFYTGKFLKERRRYMFCFVMSCINCASMPLGTILGVFSLVTLTRAEVKVIFGHEITVRQ